MRIYQHDLQDLTGHEAEVAAHESFSYVLLDDAERVLPGCVHIGPPENEGADAEISWWLVDEKVGPAS